jgi:hypothetical protein
MNDVVLAVKGPVRGRRHKAEDIEVQMKKRMPSIPPFQLSARDLSYLSPSLKTTL